MATNQARTQVIDADAHVIETERVWDYLEPSERKFRPTLVSSPDNPKKEEWFLDGECLGLKFPAPNKEQAADNVKKYGRLVETPVDARELADVKTRLAHMDELGIDVQVLFN